MIGETLQAQKAHLFNHLRLLLNVRPDSALVEKARTYKCQGTYIYISGHNDPSNYTDINDSSNRTDIRRG